MSCTKRRYKDEISAQLALFDTTRRKNHRRETRYYYCNRCNGYHLTSQEKFDILKVLSE